MGDMEFKPKGRPFNTLTMTKTSSQEVFVDPCCCAYLVKNTGDEVVRVNNFTLLPPPGAGLSGESISVEGDEGDTYEGRIALQFAGGGTNPQVEIMQVIYLNKR